MKCTKQIALMTAALLTSAVGALAQAPQAPALDPGPEGWKLELTPYLWFMGYEGDITVNGKETDFDKSYGDIVDGVDVGGSLLGVIQYNRFLIWGQVDYLDYDTDGLDVEDQPQGGSLQSQMLLAEAAVGYQVDGWAEGQTFDILVGARNLHMENDLEVYGKGSYSRDNDVTDPIIVVRPSIPMFPSRIDGLRFNPTLAIGGGGDADLVYELQPQIQYAINEMVAARVGYRTVGYKFKGEKNEDNELNFSISGLIVGLGVTF